MDAKTLGTWLQHPEDEYMDTNTDPSKKGASKKDARQAKPAKPSKPGVISLDNPKAPSNSAAAMTSMATMVNTQRLVSKLARKWRIKLDAAKKQRAPKRHSPLFFHNSHTTLALRGAVVT